MFLNGELLGECDVFGDSLTAVIGLSPTMSLDRGDGVSAPCREQPASPPPGARPLTPTLGGRRLRHGRCWGIWLCL